MTEGEVLLGVFLRFLFVADSICGANALVLVDRLLCSASIIKIGNTREQYQERLRRTV